MQSDNAAPKPARLRSSSRTNPESTSSRPVARSMRLISSMSPRSSNRVAIVPYPKVGAQLHAPGRHGNPTRPFPVGALCTFSADLVLRPVDDDALVEVIPLLVVVDRLLRIHDRDGLALPHKAPDRRVIVPVRRHAVYIRVEALALGQHVVVEKRRGAGMRCAPRDRD